MDFVLNVALFVPLGAAVWTVTGSPTRALVAGLLVSLVIETLQVQVVAGRDASAGDVLANALGALSGALIAMGVVRIHSVTGTAAHRFAVWGGIVTAHLVAASTLLLQPRQTVYRQWLQWTPAKTREEPFRGTLDAVEFNGHALRRGDILNPSETLDSATRTLTLKATVSGVIPASQRPAIIVRTAYPNEEEAMQLTQRGYGVAFRAYSVASRLQLRTVQVALDNALLPSATNAVDHRVIDVESGPRRIAIDASQGDQGITSVTLARTVGLTWALFVPWNVAIGPDWWLANAGWLAALIFPVSYLTSRSSRTGDQASTIISWWPTAFVVVTLGVLPPLTGLSPLAFTEWLGVTSGILGGVAMERLIASRLTRT